MSGSHINTTAHGPQCISYRGSIHHTQQSAPWALRPSSWIYTLDGSCFRYHSCWGVGSLSRSLSVSFLTFPQLKKSLVVILLQYYSTTKDLPSLVLQQHLKIYVCRIPSIPESFLLFREHFPSGQVGAQKRKCACQLYKSRGRLHRRNTV